MDAVDAEKLWAQLIRAVETCQKCDLCKTRTNVVPGEGNRNADLMFIGEGPGRDEDLTGRPFVGKAGQLLDKMIAAIGLKREEVYIANIVKCRPPGNRVPREIEAESCLPYLRRQVYLVRPRIIVCLGATAMRYVIDKNASITSIRGQWFERKGYWLMATYHPAALLRDPAKKYDAWEDFKKIRDKLHELGLKP
ncbi:DNA polymerase [Caldicoprobacter guelmensis]|uniref:uracil-DNA glycosylase n=1 Tax=Caldicoprobacter guelmensis TaxID=1170224 RepID=UPI00195E6D0C|nr:uracil-DNA glycosylase [Caldicoprobacter guelmensis]MBM7582823.1 DNA polymerase [Caldicoprobacter guelmensis]